MTRTATPSAARGPAAGGASDQRPADVFVIFGITGDLAKVMTFRSLYRLERAGCSTARSSAWRSTTGPSTSLSERARESIEGTGEKIDPKVFDRFAERLSYVAGDFADAATYERVGRGDRAAPRARCSTSRSRRSSSAPSSRAWPRPGLTKNAPRRRREAVRPRPRVGARARRRAAPVHRRVPALPDRPLPRQDGARGDPLPALRRTRCSSRSGTATTSSAVQITMAESFGVEDRGHFYDPVGALRDVVVNHLMQVVAAARDGGARPAATRRRSRTRRSALFRSMRDGRPGALRPRPVRRLSRHRRRRTRLDDRDVRRAAARHRQLALVGRAVLHPHRQAPAGDPDRAPARLQAAAPARLRVRGSPRPSRTSSWSSSTRRPASGSSLEAHRADRAGPAPIELDMEFADEGGEGATPYEVLLHAAMVGDSTRFTRQDGVEETWRIMQPLLDAPPPVHPYAPGSLGARRRPSSSSPATVAGTSRGWRHERRRETGQKRQPQSAAAPSPFPPIADYAFLSELPHRRARRARRRDRLALRAARSTRRASFGSLLDREAGLLPLRAVRHQPPHGARRTSRARTCSRRRGRRRPAGSSSATR